MEVSKNLKYKIRKSLINEREKIRIFHIKNHL